MMMRMKMRMVVPLLSLCLAVLCAAGWNVAGAQEPEGEKKTVTAVSVPEPDKVVIEADISMIEGQPVLLTDPVRVLVDIKNADLGAEVAGEIQGKGLVSRVEVKHISYTKPPVVRVTAFTKEDVSYNLESGRKKLVLTLKSKERAAKEPEEVAVEGTMPYDETKKELERLLSGAAPQPFEAPTTAVAASPAPPPQMPETESGTKFPPMLPEMPPPNPDGSASVAGEVLYRVPDKGIQIMIMTNGAVHDYLDFNVMHPPKLIVDLWGVKAGTPKETYPVHTAGVKRVRVGQHADKTRVVIDFKSELPLYNVQKTASGVVVSIYENRYKPGGINFQEYTTGQSDTLRSIAEDFYQNPDNWPRIVSANRDKFTKKELENISKHKGNVVLGENLVLRMPLR